MAGYLSGKRVAETSDISKSWLSHFSQCVIILSSLHPPDVMSFLIFSSSYLLFFVCSLFCLSVSHCVVIVSVVSSPPKK